MDRPDNETRQRILDVAETLFSQRGFASVKLRDIAAEVGMRHASLYYYAPGGKEQLFIEVMERNFHRHRQGLSEAVASAGGDLRGQAHAVASWLAAQPPMDMTRMLQADLPAIDAGEGARLADLAYNSLSQPIVEALEAANEAGVTAIEDTYLAAMALVTLVQSVHAIPYLRSPQLREQISHGLVDLLLDGLMKH